jgi:transcription elongation factor GreA
MLEELKNKLGEEIERLTHELQIVLPKAIQKAVEHGDLRENSEYKSALERQQFVQARLNHLTRRYGELSKIDLSEVPTDRVGFGSRVTVVDLRTKEEETYTLVFGDYIDIDSGQISVASPLGQTLIVTSGCGWAQTEGGPKEIIQPGDVIWTPPNVRHWHGAQPHSTMSHYSIVEPLNGSNVEWMEKVTDEQYRPQEQGACKTALPE